MGLLLALKLNVTQDTARLLRFEAPRGEKGERIAGGIVHCCLRLAFTTRLIVNRDN